MAALPAREPEFRGRLEPYLGGQMGSNRHSSYYTQGVQAPDKRGTSSTKAAVAETSKGHEAGDTGR